jgi:hypothetical protein
MTPLKAPLTVPLMVDLEDKLQICVTMTDKNINKETHKNRFESVQESEIPDDKLHVFNDGGCDIVSLRATHMNLFHSVHSRVLWQGAQKLQICVTMADRIS